MIDEITTTYAKNGVQVSLTVKYDYESAGMTYDLAEMFCRVIEDAQFNPQIIIDQLRGYFAEYLDDEDKDTGRINAKEEEEE